MATSKKRKPGKHKTQRQGLSGNPRKRAEQLREPRDDGDRDAIRELAWLMADGADPADWWPESHDRILRAARASDWPSGLADVEALTCRLVGDEFYERFDSAGGGLHPAQWLVSLVEGAAAGIRASVLNETGDWHGLYALLCGLALTAPLPPSEEGETSRLAREFFPDILDPYDVAQAEAAEAAELLACRGLSPGAVIASGAVSASSGARPCGEPLLARDAYGSRLLLAAPFGYGGQTDHWYAWDIDQCWVDMVAAAGTFGSAEEALAEWQESAGAPAAGAALAPCPAAALPLLLAPCLQTGPLSQTLMGGEPRELIREFYRMRRRARALAWRADVPDEKPFSPEGAVAAFGDWHAARHGAGPADFGATVGTIVEVWGPPGHLDERAFHACSPHRVELTAHLLRDGYQPEHANASLAVLPEWAEWCLTRADPGEEFAARTRAAARAEAASPVDPDEPRPRKDPDDETPFRRRE